MSDFFANLAGRIEGTLPVLRPRLPSLFETGGERLSPERDAAVPDAPAIENLERPAPPSVPVPRDEPSAAARPPQPLAADESPVPPARRKEPRHSAVREESVEISERPVLAATRQARKSTRRRDEAAQDAPPAEASSDSMETAPVAAPRARPLAAKDAPAPQSERPLHPREIRPAIARDDPAPRADAAARAVAAVRARTLEAENVPAARPGPDRPPPLQPREIRSAIARDGLAPRADAAAPPLAAPLLPVKPAAPPFAPAPPAPVASERRRARDLAALSRETAEPTIHVSIGRIEIRADTDAPPRRKPAGASPVMSLDEYLRSRAK